MKLLVHKNSRDVAYQFLRVEGDEILTRAWNINYAKISGGRPLNLGMFYLPKKPILENMINMRYTAYEKD